MKRFLLDSNAVNLFVFRRRGVYERTLAERRAGATIGTAIPIVAEMLGGTLASDTVATNLPIVEQRISTLQFWPFDLAAARIYARLYADLKATGVTMQVIDRMIAAIALGLRNCTVVTTDSDLGRVPGLRVENWSS